MAGTRDLQSRGPSSMLGRSTTCHFSSMVEHDLAKVEMRVQFSQVVLNTSLKGRTVQYVRLITFTIAGSTPASAIKIFGVL